MRENRTKERAGGRRKRRKASDMREYLGGEGIRRDKRE